MTLLPRRAGVAAPTFHHSALLLPFFALLPTCLWMACGYGGQDFDFHVPSWLELHRAWAAHEWRLGWAAGAQYGFGEPRFPFYPPLSLLLGGLLSFAVPLPLLPGVVAWLALTAAGASMWAAWGRLLGTRGRLLAATAYMGNWYLLASVVIRYAIAEAWVLALLPLTFLFAYLSLVDRRLGAVPGLGLLLGAAWLTNIPSSIVLFYSLGILAVVMAVRGRSPVPLAGFALAEAGALGVAAFRILPAFTEARAIQARQMLRALDFRTSLLGPHMAAPHALQYYFAGSPVLLGALLLPAAWALRRRGWVLRTAPFAAFFLVMFFFELPLSIPAWRLLPQLAYVGFAFRFLSVFSLAAVFVAVAAARESRVPKQLRGTLFALMGALSLFPFFFFFHGLFAFQRFPSLAGAARQWSAGYPGVPEYVSAPVPRSVANPDAERAGLGRPLLAGASDDCTVAPVNRTPNTIMVRVQGQAACTLRLNVFAYPFWKASLRGGMELPSVPDRDGLLAARLPAAASAASREVTFRFLPGSPLRTWTPAASAAIAALLLSLAAAGTRLPAGSRSADGRTLEQVR